MNEVSTIGLDLAKNVFQVHGADASGRVVIRKQLRRGQVLAFFSLQPPCVVAMEACSGAHFWAREIGKLRHEVRLIPPAYVKPFVKRQKNDMADAEAISEAAQRPTMRFVAVKSEQAQGAAMVFRIREHLIRQRTQAINALRGHLGIDRNQLCPSFSSDSNQAQAMVKRGLTTDFRDSPAQTGPPGGHSRCVRKRECTEWKQGHRPSKGSGDGSEFPRNKEKAECEHRALQESAALRELRHLKRNRDRNGEPGPSQPVVPRVVSAKQPSDAGCGKAYPDNR